MAAVHHWAERWRLRVDGLFAPLARPFNPFVKLLSPHFDGLLNRVVPPLGKVFTALGLAVEVRDLRSHPSETTQALFEEAGVRGIAMWELRLFGLPRRIFLARHGAKTVVFEGLPRPARAQPSLSWIDDKAEMKRRFKAAGFPVAEGKFCRTEAQALRAFHALQKPVVVKPHEGSGGAHVTVHITTPDELRRAFWNARQVAPAVMVEEELAGPVFRATLIGRRLAAVLRRDPPHVVGDGRRTVRELAAEENENPLRRGPVFAKINVDAPESARELAWQKKALDSVPAKGEAVYFHFKVNWGVGGTSRDATDETHPENAQLFGKIGEYLGDDIAGIDFMIPDISKPWTIQRCGVIECNSLPLIGNHHFPYKGSVRNVAGKVWDMVFPE
jgi:D-alanine-D-alanine ligase-like ATP-grasp enzyme